MVVIAASVTVFYGCARGWNSVTSGHRLAVTFVSTEIPDRNSGCGGVKREARRLTEEQPSSRAGTAPSVDLLAGYSAALPAGLLSYRSCALAGHRSLALPQVRTPAPEPATSATSRCRTPTGVVEDGARGKQARRQMPDPRDDECIWAWGSEGYTLPAVNRVVANSPGKVAAPAVSHRAAVPGLDHGDPPTGQAPHVLDRAHATGVRLGGLDLARQLCEVKRLTFRAS